jgi:hypothetical protein
VVHQIIAGAIWTDGRRRVVISGGSGLDTIDVRFVGGGRRTYTYRYFRRRFRPWVAPPARLFKRR